MLKGEGALIWHRFFLNASKGFHMKHVSRNRSRIGDS